MLGIRLGVAAVKVLLEGQKNVMAGIANNSLTLTPFENVGKQHQVNTELQELLTLFYLK
jgi:6-phosphofructokinase 1